MRVSIIVPAYNEVGTIATVLGKLRDLRLDGITLEVIAIDDGSSDGTGARLEAEPDLYHRLIRRPVNGGKGAAVRDGLAAATGDYVLFQDADLEYDPAEYSGLLFPVTAFDADMVLGSRFLSPRYTRVHYFWHKLGNSVITLLFNILYNRTFTDIYSCYLLFRRSLLDLDAIRSNGWDQQAEILCQLSSKARTVYEVPISYHGRSYDEGKKIRAQHAIAVVLMILRRRIGV